MEERVAPRGTGFEPDLYSTPPATPLDKWSPDIIEKEVMSPIDNAAARVLANLTAGRLELDQSERRAWARFLNSLLERHPSRLAERDARAEVEATNFVAEFRDRLMANANDLLSLIDAPTMAKNAVRTFMVQQINDKDFLDHLVSMHEWLIVDAGEDPFITSDRPLLVNASSTDSRPVYMLTLPISPRHLFVSYPKSWATDSELQSMLRVVAGTHNLIVVLQSGARRLYSARPVMDGATVRLRTAIENAFARPTA